MHNLQAEVIDFLKNPQSYFHKVSKISHIQTHVSHLFLTGEFVYKLKKNISLDFLDFSTVEKRKFYCQEELRLNSRFSPDIYLEVVPIYKNKNKLSFEQNGEIVDYVVKMKQFDNKFLFENLITNSQLSEELLIEACKEISNFHKKAENTPNYGNSKKLQQHFLDNFKVCKSFMSSSEEGKLIEKTQELCLNTLEKLSPLIEKRRASFVKALHGDLHLKNICVFNGRAHLFDGIEFNPEYSCCDVWEDLSFLIMDLLFRNQTSLASVVWNYYLEALDDYEGLILLDLFIAYRATVRAKVTYLLLRENKQQQDILKTANNYLELAKNILTPKRGCIIAVGGLSGSGKTTLSRLIAKEIAAIHIRSDAVRKHIAGIDLNQTAKHLYTSDMSEKTYQGLLQRAEIATNLGKTVIIDAVFNSEKQRTDFEDLAKNKNIDFHGIWCEVPFEIAKERIAKRHNDISDANEEVLKKQSNYNLGNLSWDKVNASADILKVLEEALKLIQKNAP